MNESRCLALPKESKVFVLSDYVHAKDILHHCRSLNPSSKLSADQISTSTAGKYEESVAKQLDSGYDIGIVDPFLFAPYVNHVTNVKWISSTYAGVNEIIDEVTRELKSPCFKLTRLGGVYGQHMAEYVIGQITVHERKFPQSQMDQRNSFWNEKNRLYYRSMKTLTIGILGVGDIGKHVAKCCKTFAMKVHGLVTKINPTVQDEDLVDRYFTCKELPALLQSVDYICNILPETPETIGLLSADMLRNCAARKAVFINVGRGSICTEEDIATALEKGYISHAILDVFPVEPLPQESLLWRHPQITCTPHNSCVPTRQEVTEHFWENYELFAKELPLKFQVPL